MDAKRAEAERIVRTLRGAGYEAYFAGGCVRDMVMGREPSDYDIATSARPEDVARLFPRAYEVGAKFGVVVVHGDTADFEVATFRAEAEYSDGRHPDRVKFSTAREDVLRRDFTINGMFFDPVSGEVLDWVGGREDIRLRRIRTIGEPERRFAEDHLRILRAVRFACRFGFSVEPETYRAMASSARALERVSAERVREELVRILTGPNAGRALRLMHDCGILAVILPEVEEMCGVEQPAEFHPEGDVFEHTCRMFDLAREPSPELAMGILLHDVGKPCTQTFRERIRFDDHDREGALRTKEICRRLRFSNEETAHITSLVANHMRILSGKEMRLSTLKRLLALPRFEEHLELHRLDCLASHGKLDVYEFLRDRMQTLRREEIAPAPLVTGHDLIALGYRPGPLFGRILSAVREEQLDGRLDSREAALKWIRERWPPDERG